MQFQKESTTKIIETKMTEGKSEIRSERRLKKKKMKQKKPLTKHTKSAKFKTYKTLNGDATKTDKQVFDSLRHTRKHAFSTI